MIVFVCEHGAAKSVLAATYFDKFAMELGLNLWAIARGTNPEPVLSPQVVSGLAVDGMTPNESTPQRLTRSDIQAARRIVSFCELPAELRQPTFVEYWRDIPPVSENYELARDAIVDHLRQLITTLE